VSSTAHFVPSSEVHIETVSSVQRLTNYHRLPSIDELEESNQ
jgi:hypothetical protein